MSDDHDSFDGGTVRSTADWKQLLQYASELGVSINFFNANIYLGAARVGKNDSKSTTINVKKSNAVAIGNSEVLTGNIHNSNNKMEPDETITRELWQRDIQALLLEMVNRMDSFDAHEDVWQESMASFRQLKALDVQTQSTAQLSDAISEILDQPRKSNVGRALGILEAAGVNLASSAVWQYLVSLCA